ncbi:MAG: putative glycoside hydrolase [Clostridia bacterium]|nr:putative glycoside hydrolase [Clostridia bacterium]
MRKIALISIVLLVVLSTFGCGNNASKQVEVNIEINESQSSGSNLEENNLNQGIDEEVQEDEKVSNETNGDASEEKTDSESGSESSESAGGNDDSTGDTSEPSESTEVTSEDSSEPSETSDESSGEVAEEVVEEPIDYTAKISKPYDDLDYSPQVKLTEFANNPAIHVKGVFITANTAASSRIHDFVELLNNTELNALVIDVKNDNGTILFHSQAAEKYVPEANSGAQIKDMEAFMQLMKENNIYTIARIVTFKSPKYAKKYPERAISYLGSGEVYYADGAYWASPFDQELWQYNVEIAKEAVAYGFNEIQFDYVRFPATGSNLDKSLDFKNPNNNSKSFAVQEFVKYAREEINAMDAFVALDVFGWTATTVNDSGIGQHWEGMSNVSDYMCPMVYPSHYGENIFGLKVPDAHPYTTVFEAMSDAQERNANIETPAKLRPWLQAFTATWVDGHIAYRRDEIQAQIQACEDLGIEDYIFWNAGNNYNEGWFDKEE